MKYQHSFYSKCFAALVILIVTFTSNNCEAFVSNSRSLSRSPAFSTELHMFGNALKNAFSNDDNLGKPKNAGLKNVCEWHHSEKSLF